MKDGGYKYSNIVFRSLRFVPCRITDHLLTDNSPHFVTKLHVTLCGILEDKHMINEASHPRPTDSLTGIKLMSCAYGVMLKDTKMAGTFLPNRRFNRLALRGIVSLFSLVVSSHPPGCASFDFPTANILRQRGKLSFCILCSIILAKIKLMRLKKKTTV